MGIVTIIQDVFSDYYYGDDEELYKSCIQVDDHYTQMNFDTSCTLIGVECRVGHDGYDKLGAKSNLFDVYVFYRKVGEGDGAGDAAGGDGDAAAGSGCGDDAEKSVNIYMDIWHAEQWYTKNEVVLLELSESYLFHKEEDYKSFVSWVHKGGFNCRPVVKDACIYKNYGVWEDWDELDESYHN